MPTKPVSAETQDLLRRQEWEDREFWNEKTRLEREHEKEILAMKNTHNEALTKLKYTDVAAIKAAEISSSKLALAKANDRLSRLAVRCITLLQLFGRPTPKVLEDLLHWSQPGS